jgi:hypothetical protein
VATPPSATRQPDRNRLRRMALGRRSAVSTRPKVAREGNAAMMLRTTVLLLVVGGLPALSMALITCRERVRDGIYNALGGNSAPACSEVTARDRLLCRRLLERDNMRVTARPSGSARGPRSTRVVEGTVADGSRHVTVVLDVASDEIIYIRVLSAPRTTTPAPATTSVFATAAATDYLRALGISTPDRRYRLADVPVRCRTGNTNEWRLRLRSGERQARVRLDAATGRLLAVMICRPETIGKPRNDVVPLRNGRLHLVRRRHIRE